MKSNTSTSRSSGTTTSPRPSDGRGTKGEGKLPATPSQTIHITADVLPTGGGNYIVTPRKPASLQIGPDGISQEIGSRDAAKILGVRSLGTMWSIRNCPDSMKFLKWRYTLPGKGKIAYDVASVYALRAASANLGK